MTTPRMYSTKISPLHVALVCLMLTGSMSDAFYVAVPKFAVSLISRPSGGCTTIRLNSSKGGGTFDGPNEDENKNNKDPNGNRRNNEADDLIANARLPISYRSDYDGTRNEEFDVNNKDNFDLNEDSTETGSVQGIESNTEAGKLTRPNEKDWENNPYVEVVSSLSPSELIGRFTATASPKVQEAVKSTILGLIGNLPKIAFESTTVTTGARLASLMFQLQMSGYMFKNAEYRMSLSKSLMSSEDRVKGGIVMKDNVLVDTVKAKVKGKVKVRYSMEGELDSEKSNNATSAPGFEVEVDADAYMSEIREEVLRLREELSRVAEAKEESIRQDLLAYIRTLPNQQLQSLTNTISEDVMTAMRGLVNVVMQGIGDGKIQPDTVTEQSSEAMAQLCMWQLVIGYNLRELEVREEMKQNLLSYGKDEITQTEETTDEDIETN